MSRALIAALIAATGCDRVFGHDLVDATVGPPGLDADAGGCLRDTFDDNRLDPLRWTLADPTNTPVSIVERDQKLVVSLPPESGPAYRANVLVGRAPQDLTDGHVEVEVVKPVSFTGGGENFLLATVDDANGYAISVGGQGTINFQIRTGGVPTSTTRTWTAADRFWRLRFADDQVYFETSADGATYLEARTAPASVPMAAVRVGLGGGAFQNTMTPGSAIFDNVRVVTPACPPAP